MPTLRSDRVKQPRMSPAEVVAELDWQRECGMSAALAARAVKRSMSSLARTCVQQGRRDLAQWLWAESKRERAA